MLSRDDTHRLAAMAGALRPDWPVKSLLTFISTQLADRTYREAAVALTWVATDPETATPRRVLEAGPWWNATRAHAATVSVIPTMCADHPAQKAWRCPDCAEDLAAVDHEAHAAHARDQIRRLSAERRRLTRGAP